MKKVPMLPATTKRLVEIAEARSQLERISQLHQLRTAYRVHPLNQTAFELALLLNSKIVADQESESLDKLRARLKLVTERTDLFYQELHTFLSAAHPDQESFYEFISDSTLGAATRAALLHLYRMWTGDKEEEKAGPDFPPLVEDYRDLRDAPPTPNKVPRKKRALARSKPAMKLEALLMNLRLAIRNEEDVLPLMMEIEKLILDHQPASSLAKLDTEDRKEKEPLEFTMRSILSEVRGAMNALHRSTSFIGEVKQLGRHYSNAFEALNRTNTNIATSFLKRVCGSPIDEVQSRVSRKLELIKRLDTFLRPMKREHDLTQREEEKLLREFAHFKKVKLNANLLDAYVSGLEDRIDGLEDDGRGEQVLSVIFALAEAQECLLAEEARRKGDSDEDSGDDDDERDDA